MLVAGLVEVHLARFLFACAIKRNTPTHNNTVNGQTTRMKKKKFKMCCFLFFFFIFITVASARASSIYIFLKKFNPEHFRPPPLIGNITLIYTKYKNSGCTICVNYGLSVLTDP